MIAFISRYRHMNWALADQAMVSGVNFLTGILLARYLGLEEYGRFTLAWMAVLLCNSFQQAGIIAPMMSIGPKQKKEDGPSYYGTLFIHQQLSFPRLEYRQHCPAFGCCFVLMAVSGFYPALFFCHR